MLVRVCVRACACVRARARVCVCVCVLGWQRLDKLSKGKKRFPAKSLKEKPVRVKKGADVISDRNTCITSHMTDRKPNGKTSEPSINNVTCTSANHLNQWSCRVTVKSVALRPQKPSGLLGTGRPGRPPRLSHSS